MKTFKKYECVPTSIEGKSLKNTTFSRKYFFFLLQIFTCNYLPAEQNTVGKNSLNGRERYIIFQFMFMVFAFYTIQVNR